MNKKELEYHRNWRENNRNKINKNAKRYRKRHLEVCRKRTRLSQIRINNLKRFGGFRMEVLQRDNYRCKKCNKDVSGKYMAEVHHINQIKTDHRMKNLITLCKACHHLRDTHPNYWQ
jgi:5-methylcytosine-specific restriction endonuclease McrA